MPVTGPVLSRNRTGPPGRFGVCAGNGAGLEAALERKLLTEKLPIIVEEAGKRVTLWKKETGNFAMKETFACYLVFADAVLTR